MIRFTTGNLLEANAEALVNTVNTVGVMGKGVALMFKEAYPENYQAYRAACKKGKVRVGHMFVHERTSVMGPKWIINFPTKEHWRGKSRIEWIRDGLVDLRRTVQELGIRSLAIPPLGAGQGGLRWEDVRPEIESALSDLGAVEVVVYEPTEKYQNVSKRRGVEKLTPARALVAELVRRYWVLGIECSLLEIQKLAWFLERAIALSGLPDPLDLRFAADRYGPYADRLKHLLDSLDGSYLHCDKRLADASPFDVIRFDDSKRDRVAAYLASGEGQPYVSALNKTSEWIDGFESPLGLELLATVDWLVHRENCTPTNEGIRKCLANWPGGDRAGERKERLFDDRLIRAALERLSPLYEPSASPAVNGLEFGR
jgi:O-acetyl-ADP-ribose deacetylase (regulator of RNase III)